MTSLELIDKKEQLKLQAENILSGAEKESRKLNDEEATNYSQIIEQINDLDKELREITNQLNKNNDNKIRKNYFVIF